MSVQQKEIDVYQSARFEKAMKKLPESDVKVIEDEIDRIIENPLIGELKKGDLAHLRVHKFRLNELLVLLGYSWVSDKLELYLLHIVNTPFITQSSRRIFMPHFDTQMASCH